MAHKTKLVSNTGSTAAPKVKQGDHVIFTIPGKTSNRPGKAGKLIRFQGQVTSANNNYNVSVCKKNNGQVVTVPATHIKHVYPAGSVLQTTVG